MSHVVDHVNEAQIHAYLDRDLEFADPEVHKAVGAHIADCSKCSALLKSVRRVYEASNELLDISAPPARPAPSFENIVKRAAKRTGADGASRFMRAQGPSMDPGTNDDDGSDAHDITDAVVSDPIEWVESEPTQTDVTPADRDDQVVPAEPLEFLAGGDPEADLVAEVDEVQLDEVEVSPAAAEIEEPIADKIEVGTVEVVQAAADEMGALANDEIGPEAVTEEEAVFPPRPDVVGKEEDIVFIQPEPIADPEVPAPVPVKAKAGRPPARGRRGTRLLALAATIVVAVGIGGWFGRPYLIERFSGAQPTVATSSPRAATEQQPTNPPARQERAASGLADSRLGVGEPTVAAALDRFDTAAVRSDSVPARRLDAAESDAASGAAPSTPSLAGRAIVGSVRDADSKQVIPGAQVVVVGTNRGALTDSTGRFAITGVPTGSVSVDVVGLGYERSEKALTISERENTVADFELRRSASSVDELQVTAEDRAVRAREAPAAAVVAGNRATGWSVTTRRQAESVLGGPLVAIDGLAIDRVERSPNEREIRVTQTTRAGQVVYLRISSTGSMGSNATLDFAEVTSREGARIATGRATYGNYVVTVEAFVTADELASLLRRISVAPNVD